jgi:NADH dehydrogenase subunit D (EC 1.6.5.3)
LRMNHAYIRPGGVAVDLPDDAIPQIRAMLKLMPDRLKDLEDLLTENHIWKARTQGVVFSTSPGKKNEYPGEPVAVLSGRKGKCRRALLPDR